MDSEALELDSPRYIDLVREEIERYIGLGCNCQINYDLCTMRYQIHLVMPGEKVYSTKVAKLAGKEVSLAVNTLMETICDTYEYPSE